MNVMKVRPTGSVIGGIDILSEINIYYIDRLTNIRIDIYRMTDKRQKKLVGKDRLGMTRR